MKKILIIMLTSILLIGCSKEEKVSGTLTEVTVKDKKKTEECFRGCAYEWSVIVGKDNQKIKLSIDEESMYESLIKGSIVNVTYDEDFTIIDISFPKLEK